MELQGPWHEGNLVGTLLDGRYRVGPVLARGGTSTVFRGTDTRLDRPVAIKVMDPRFAADPVFLHRFEREARAAARLHHPGIVGVYDQGVDAVRNGAQDAPTATHAFLVMELIDGGTLRDLLRERGTLPVPLALAVTDLVLSALAAAHREGLVHRDVKPENVLIGAGGTVKVADFGLVRAVAEASSNTGDVILGTVAYLSPEQVATGAADARSDVYATGVLLFEMLTGRPPFTGETALSVAYRHVNDDVPAPSTIVSQLPAALDALVQQATRRDPEARPADAAAFLTALWRVRAELGIGPVPIPTPVADTAPLSTAPAIAPAPRTDPYGVPAWQPGAGAPAAVAAPPSGHGPRGTRALTRADPAAPPGGPVGPPPRKGGMTGATPGGPYPDDPYRLERSRDRRAFLVWMLVVLLLATTVGVAAWWLGSGRWTSVPELSGLQRDAVEATLAGAGLEATLTEDHHDAVPRGTVIGSDPASGHRAVRGSKVTVVLSAGRPVVPDLQPGASTRDAERLLRDTDLTARRDQDVQQFHDTVPPGRVIALAPPSGTELTVGAPVSLVISKGPGPTTVPAVGGLPEAQAVAALADAGLTATVRREFDDSVPGGHAIGTDPDTGAETMRGTEITLVVSNALVVPDVVGQSRDQAIAALTAAGFAPEERGSGAGQPGATVRSLQPSPGELVDPADNEISVRVSNEVPVPDVVGRPLGEAERILADAGFRSEANQFFGDSSSRVVAQFPGAGRSAPPGATIRLATF